MSSRIHVEKGNSSDENCDDLNDSQINEYKDLVYKLFQFRTYKLKCSNGDFGCPFCDDYKEENRDQYVHLLLHAIRVGEGSEYGKQRANHFAMSRYLVIDLANEFKAESDGLSKAERDAIDKVLHLERELNDKEKTLKNLLKENEDLKHLNQNLLAREQKSNADLQALLKENEDLKHSNQNLLAREQKSNASLQVMLKENEDLKLSNQNLLARKQKSNAELQVLLKENEGLQHSNQNLLAKEQKSNAELKGVREELIKGLNGWQSGNKSGFGIKQMGQIDADVIKRVCSKRYPVRPVTIAKELCNLWQKKLENPQWHPFRMVEDDKGNLERVVSEEDEALRFLKLNRGDEIYSEVLRALKDLCEYNPTRSHTVAELWNFGENRKAKLEEVISCVFTQMMQQSNSKRKRKT